MKQLVHDSCTNCFRDEMNLKQLVHGERDNDNVLVNEIRETNNNNNYIYEFR